MARVGIRFNLSDFPFWPAIARCVRAVTDPKRKFGVRLVEGITEGKPLYPDSTKTGTSALVCERAHRPRSKSIARLP
jgi:hypothetical protein